MNRTDDLTTALRALDPADVHVDPTGPRARADLEAILAGQHPHRGVGHEGLPDGALVRLDAHRRRTPSPRTVRRVALVATTAAAMTAGTIALPALTGGGDRAFATWTPEPGSVPAQQRSDAADACRASLASGAGDGYESELEAARTAIAETRGVWTAVVLAGDDGFSALCVTDDSAGLFTGGSIGAIGFPAGETYRDPGPQQVLATSLGTGSMNGSEISLAAGDAGSAVVGVTYRSAAHGPVEATVSDGRFALWMPGEELRDAARDGAELEVTYRDGTTGTATVTLD